VLNEMLSEFKKCIGTTSLPTLVYAKTQLWGAALPTNTPGVSCIFDGRSRVGICGDWVTGASMQAAALSGISMARKLKESSLRTSASSTNVDEGLEVPLHSISSTALGQFPL
jgi:predicted NAD/FAD-dependent oxidoreductase